MSRSREFCGGEEKISRREFARRAGLAAGAWVFLLKQEQTSEAAPVRVAVVQGQGRPRGIQTVLQLLGAINVGGRDVYLKASYNSADPFPGSTHPEMLRAVASSLRSLGCGTITLVERSGMGTTSEIWQELGVPAAVKDLDVKLLALETMTPESWRREEWAGSHWKHGVEVPGFLTREACVVQISNLKTHRFGGIFSASLKNSIGLVAKHGRVDGAPYNYMRELHASADQRLMIAEVNQVYSPALVILDATRIFVDGGPDIGYAAQPDAILASSDRVAIDAAGLALLRLHGGRKALGDTDIFKQEQIKRAVELGLGVKSSKELALLPADEASQRLVFQMNANLLEPAEPPKP